ncbi:MAG TPA: MFS transporter [Rubrobacteraceae bacterium]|nr:MFS transporter [Rubrobacteraceae bacterium]
MERPSNEDPSQASIRQILGASFIGTTIEWYDYFLYGTAAALVFPQLFFPGSDPLIGTLQSFALFAVGFIVRPLGGIIFGHFGDRVGRKSMLVLSLNMMGIATFLIGALPTYETIGVLAPILLALLRTIQGLGVGGEWGGAALLAVENAPEGRRGYFGSWPQMGVPAGLFFSTVIFFAVSALPNEQFLSFGWRIPFLLSIILVGVGLFVRLRLLETPAFSQVQEQHSEAQMPVLEVLRTYPKNVLLAIGARVASDASFYIFAVFVLDYATRSLGVPRGTILLAVAIASIVELFTIPAFAMLSDRVGRRPIYLAGAALTLVFAYPYFLLLETRSAILIVLASVLGLSVAHALMYGPMTAFFSELFGTRVRYSGISMGYQLSAILGGGLAPIIATSLVVAGGGDPWLVAAYMVALCIITLVSVLLTTETFRGGEFSAERQAAEQS